MLRFCKWILPAIAVMLSPGIAYASGSIGVYAIVDKVIFEPDTNRPERLQIWGVFVFPSKDSPSVYTAPQRGYLYLKRGGDDLPSLLEWANLRSRAGTRQVVGFGSLGAMRIRNPDDRPENPDLFHQNAGVVELRADTDFPPVKALLEFTKPGRH